MDGGATGGEPVDALARRIGLRAALRRLAAAGVALASTRAELFTVELAEERDRLIRRVALVAAGGLIIAFGVMFVGWFVIALFWDTYRMWAIALVAAAHLGAGAFLLMRARGVGRDAGAPFAASLEELGKDRAALERVLGDREDEA